MIDLTPLEVRKKKGDFARTMRGYEPARVDDFLDLAADRLEDLVRENATLRERVNALGESVTSFREREQAMNEALVSAQQLREEIRSQATREAELVLREARGEAERVVAEAQSRVATAADALQRVQAQRVWFMRAFRALVERQLGEIEQEDERLRSAPASTERETPAPHADREAGGAVEASPSSWLSSIDGGADHGYAG